MIFSADDTDIQYGYVDYFISKHNSKGIDRIYADPHNITRIGIKYNIDVQIYVKKDKIEYRYSTFQYVVDDKLSACLPSLFVEYTEYVYSFSFQYRGGFIGGCRKCGPFPSPYFSYIYF